MHIEVFKAEGFWRFEIISGNNRVIATSVTGYQEKRKALEAASRLATEQMEVVERGE